MAITSEQAQQLMSAYQAGGSGLQGLVNQMGVTQADVAQYFPGFDVGAAGLTLPTAPAAPVATTPVAPPAPRYGDQGQFSAQDVTNYIQANLADPTRIAQAATQYKVAPTDILKAYQESGQSPYTAQQITDYLAQGTSGFQPRFQEIVSSTLGKPEDQAALEKFMGLKEGDLSKTALDPTKFSGLSIENIEKTLQESQANRYQEAARAANIMQNIYGASKEDAIKTSKNLLENKETDAKTQNLYDQLLKFGLTNDVQNQIFQDAAVRAPNSDFFKNNPQALAIYSPVGEIKRGEETAGTYGLDPKTNLPFLHKTAFDKALGDDVILSGQEDFTNSIKHQYVGADPHSRYAGTLARGVGIFGVDASGKEMSEFDKIEREIARLGGVKREKDAEGTTQDVVYVPRVDSETGQKFVAPVNVQSLFANEKDETGYNNYKKYVDTQNNLRKAAAAIGIDAGKYTNTKQAYDELNEKLKDQYLWQGRTKDLDPSAAAALGITPEKLKEDKQHATVQYRAVGDKLVPIKTLRTFDFQDPNTTRGFFGDLASGIMDIISVPPIAIALGMAGGLPSLLSGNLVTGMAAGAGSAELASAMAGSMFNPANLGSMVADKLGLAALDAGTKNLIGNIVLNSGMSGLTTGLATGDLDKAGLAALTGGAGATVAGLSQPFLKDLVSSFTTDPKTIAALSKAGSEIAGGAAGTAISGGDVEKYITNRLLGTGLSALMSTGKEAVGVPDKTADLMKAMAPIIMSKQLRPEDLVNIAQTIKRYETAQA